ncbi:hypothetical protein D9M69_593060 [compost metagenome]
MEFLEYSLGESWSVDVDVRWNHLHRVQIEIARAQKCQDFLGNTDAIDEGNVNSHDCQGIAKKRREQRPHRFRVIALLFSSQEVSEVPQGFVQQHLNVR